MERMTVRRADNGKWAIANNDGASPTEQMLKIPKAIDRLAEYENTERTPAELAVLISRDTAMVPYYESLADRNCPKCFSGINWDALNDPLSYAPNFCTNCGQRFDWKVEEGDYAEPD